LDHELKNPLTAMQIGLANLTDPATDEDARRRIYASIQGQIVRVSKLIGNLRKLADLEYGTIERLPIEVRPLVQEAFAALEEYPQAEERQLVLTLANEPLPLVEGDRDLLQVSIYNLLDNAIKFTRIGDRIELLAYQEDDWLVIEVADSGRGIAEDELPHVWEELYRSESVHGIPGSGIGLALVKAIIEKHGGYVEIDSTAGEGTNVQLYLPILEVDEETR
jgi:two-component system OmpR family sensor kinase